MDHPSEISDVELSFGEPEHGWLPIDVRIGEFKFGDLASNVLNDPLEEFLELRAFLLGEMLGRHLVSLWLEPAGYLVEVTRIDGARASFTVWFEEDFVPPRIRKTSQCVFDGVAQRESAARRIEQAYWVLRREHAARLANWGNVERYDEVVGRVGHKPG